MFDLDRWQEIYQVLTKNKLRTFLTAFGVFWGIFMLVVMLGAGNGLQNGVTQNFGDMATNSVFIWAQQTSIPYNGFPRGRYYHFKNQDVDALKKEIPEMKCVAPRLRIGDFNEVNNVIRGKKTGGFSIMGEYPVINEIDPVNIIRGRFINDFDIREKRKVVVAGIRVIDILFEKDEDPLNQYIKIKGVYFKIVGIFQSKRTGEQADQENQNIYMPFTTLQKTYNLGDNIGFFAITSNEGIPVSVVEEKAIEILKKRHSVAPVDERAIGHFNIEQEFKKMKGLFYGIDGLIWVVGIGTLLAGIIGVSNIMLIIIKERTKEIGLKRAIGATPINIITQVVLESVFLTTLAGYFGLVLGVGVLTLIDNAMKNSGGDAQFFLHPEIDFSVGITALAILIFSGIFAGLIPARRAVSIKPVDALRDE